MLNAKHSFKRKSYLKRLTREHYRNEAYVHWTMCIEERKTGWLIPIFYYKFREILTHTMFRYGLCCPIFCCMPDHIHLLWVGLFEGSDQLLAAKYLRKQTNPILGKLGAELQKQPYDHVLTEDEREKDAFEKVAEYIATNPERAALAPVDGWREYRYTSCLVPGYPELDFKQADYWERLWRAYSFVKTNGVMRRPDSGTRQSSEH
ncbi:MAG: hypothetical protein RIC55_12560 [Pirellulaceae bacterium]